MQDMQSIGEYIHEQAGSLPELVLVVLPTSLAMCMLVYALTIP